jgi:putative ATPase
MKELGYSKGYDYAHDFPPDDPRRYRQRHLPDGVAGSFYHPTNIGFEARLQERLQRIAALRKQARALPEED